MAVLASPSRLGLCSAPHLHCAGRLWLAGAGVVKIINISLETRETGQGSSAMIRGAGADLTAHHVWKTKGRSYSLTAVRGFPARPPSTMKIWTLQSSQLTR
jgi:hypothetical protein